MATRLRRVEMVERNRDAVLTAARRVFLDQGYTGATLESIAETAGFSKGVMYSQFENKAEVFLALFERRIEERAAENERIAAEHHGVDGLRAMLQAAVAHATSEDAWALLLIEFRALAAREARINRRFAELDQLAIEQLAAVLERLCREASVAPALPAYVLAQFVLAIDTGITLERAVHPGALPTEALITIVSRALGFGVPPESDGQGHPGRRQRRRTSLKAGSR